MKISWNTYTKTEMKLTQIVYIPDRNTGNSDILSSFTYLKQLWAYHVSFKISKMFLSGQSIENKKMLECLYA